MDDKPDREPMAAAQHIKAGPFAPAPEEELLYSMAPDGSRKWVDPVLTKGRYWRIRIVLAWGLIALFLGMPHVQIAGKPGIFMDIATRQFTLFGVTFHPTDNVLLLAFGISVVVLVFVITTLFGRLWCGYGCPHPIYLEFVFRPLEQLLEGTPAARRRRDAGPWTAERALRKGIKWTLYALIAVFLALTFVSYFVGFKPLVTGIVSDPLAHRGTLFALSAVSALIFFNFAYFRDQMCTVACPYGRLQTVLYDRDTVIVGYDVKRGEPRAPLRRGEDPSAKPQGDCVDCGLCVRTCPTGMDIRRGLQMECIGCAQCIEACDDVMAKVERAPGLIRYTSLRELESGERKFVRPRVFVYAALVSAALGVLVALAATRPAADVELLRVAGEPFRMMPDGGVANILQVRLSNYLHQEHAFSVELVAPKGAKLVVGQSPFVVGPDTVGTLDVVATLSEAAFENGRVMGRFVISSDAGFRVSDDFLLLGPYN